jgi:hypothetical protein
MDNSPIRHNNIPNNSLSTFSSNSPRAEDPAQRALLLGAISPVLANVCLVSRRAVRAALLKSVSFDKKMVANIKEETFM